VRARKCAFVAGGANLLHSIEKPRRAMRGFVFVNVVSAINEVPARRNRRRSCDDAGGI